MEDRYLTRLFDWTQRITNSDNLKQKDKYVAGVENMQ